MDATILAPAATATATAPPPPRPLIVLAAVAPYMFIAQPPSPELPLHLPAPHHNLIAGGLEAGLMVAACYAVFKTILAVRRARRTEAVPR